MCIGSMFLGLQIIFSNAPLLGFFAGIIFVLFALPCASCVLRAALFATLGRSWCALRVLLGRSWPLLGCSWGVLGPLGPLLAALSRSWSALGCSWPVLAPLLAALRASWGARGALLGRS